jgi:hypothetical protein
MPLRIVEVFSWYEERARAAHDTGHAAVSFEVCQHYACLEFRDRKAQGKKHHDLMY